MPHTQHLHDGTPIGIYLGRKTIYQGVWKADMLVETWGRFKRSVILAHSYNLGLHINTLWLWTLSFPSPFLLFQTVILCEESFYPNVHMYISFLDNRMSVLGMSYKGKHQILSITDHFLALIYLHIWSPVGLKEFLTYFLFFQRYQTTAWESAL
jgi:hypothetical protein